ncbi:hypothetical protein EVAR_73892_1 [Eumeta japonica]|uniref:Uncharacterized protein n=1 Tax=Eumeta variegata TaxID=151549 RepID=A0A4C1SDK9_EUMVA|nr:hypothetical protein EVAR_73892_1 [Eumeta japonica]
MLDRWSIEVTNDPIYEEIPKPKKGDEEGLDKEKKMSAEKNNNSNNNNKNLNLHCIELQQQNPAHLALQPKAYQCQPEIKPATERETGYND